MRPERRLTLWTGYIVDTFGHLRVRLLLLFLVRLWALWATRGVVHKSTGAPRLRQFPSAQPAARVDESEFDVGVTDEPFAVLGLLDRPRLADQRLANENQIASPFDHAVRPNPAHGAVRIVGLAQGARIAALGGAIERSRRGEIQGFMRTLVVIFGAESSKRRCCSASVAAGGLAVSALRVRCRRSRRPFCCGLPGSIRSGLTPSLIHHTASADSPPAPTEANGGPLSERIVGWQAELAERRVETSSARRVWLWFRSNILLFPLQDTKLLGREVRWVVPTYHAIHGVLIHPCYAGAYTYGRIRFERYIDDNGNMRSRSRRLPRDQWSVLIRDHHPGFIDWGTFEANRMRINTNTRPKPHRNEDAADVMTDGTPGRAVREGAALLQGLALCGHCGRRLRVHYSSRNVSPGYHCPGKSIVEGRGQYRLNVGGSQIDAAVSDAFLTALEPAGMEAALVAAERLEADHDAALDQWPWRSSGVITKHPRLSVDTRPLILTIGWWRAAWRRNGNNGCANSATPKRRWNGVSDNNRAI